ncbi:hypothetical protein [Actinoplanes lobatus]|uniref:Uncharacterized protein n=1 Tax=Actinoplanes lobatus TaxID=113568 RepID=A0A7W7HKU4_9ACTN|nr:hypothetical protein [Actinoplanes lobatus]MBB4752305.1 hypothetical protein [Actinoplanes lobatus]
MLIPFLAGCTAAPSTATPQRTTRVHVDQINRLNTLSELEDGSAAVIIGQAMSQTATTMRGFPITITTVQVTTVVHGSYPRKSAEIYQLGTATTASEETAAMLKTGHSYLIYISIEKDTDGGPDRTVITGGDGVYEWRDNDYHYVGGPDSRLPQTIASSAVSSRTAAAFS